MGKSNNKKYNGNSYDESKKCTDSADSRETTKYNNNDNKGKNGRRKGNNSRRDNGISDNANMVINNAAWYIDDPELRKQVASYSMNSTIGLDTKLHYNQQVPALNQTPFNVKVPSVLAMECNPSPGFTPDSESGKLSKTAINKAARMLYSDISSVNAKTTQYQPQDLVFAILSVGEIISMVSHLTRMYGVAFNYSQRNRDIPEALLLAMKVVPDSLLKDLSGFRMDLNEILVTANQITMFSNIPYFQKCWDMYSQIYTDSISTMAQIYMNVPYSTWIMDERPQTGTEMKTRVLLKDNGDLLTAKEWLAILEEMIDVLLTSTTYNYIYTDILNYVSKKGGTLYSFGYVSEMYRVGPVFNLEYLLQIHNATPYGVPTNNDVKQSVAHNSIIFTPSPDGVLPVGFMDKILDFPHTNTPSDEDKINALVYHCVASAGDHVNPNSSDYLVADAALSDHYPVQFRVMVDGTAISTTGYKLSTNKEYHNLVSFMSKFDWAPIIYTIDVDGKVISTIGDLNFYDTVPYDVIKRTYGYSFLGLFKLKSI